MVLDSGYAVPDGGYGAPYHHTMRLQSTPAGDGDDFGKQHAEICPSLDRLITGSSHIHIGRAVSPMLQAKPAIAFPMATARRVPFPGDTYYNVVEPGYSYSSPSSSSSSPPAANAGLPSLTAAPPLAQTSLLPHDRYQHHYRPQQRLPLPRSPHQLPQHQLQHKRQPSPVPSAVAEVPARKRSRHAWPAEMTRQITNVLLDEFLHDPSYRTTIYRSRDERDHRFVSSGRTVLEEYNKVQNMRRRYFIPLSYLLQWDQLRAPGGGLRMRQRANIEKKLAKPLERSRLQMIFCTALKSTTAVVDLDQLEDQEVDADCNGKTMFELDIFVSELKRRDPRLWSRGVAAFQAWVSRKCSVDFIINH